CAEPARGLVEAAGQRTARHVARPLDAADRDRRAARAHRPGVGAARLALAARRAETLSAGAGAAALAPAHRPRGGVARSLRPPRLSHDPQAEKVRGPVRD